MIKMTGNQNPKIWIEGIAVPLVLLNGAFIVCLQTLPLLLAKIGSSM